MTERRPEEIPTFPELAEDYEIIRELGRGGTAVVYLARERSLGRDVAIKLIHPSHVRDEDAVARLIREAQTVGKLQHPNIVMLLGTRRLGDGGLALILQYVPGRTLKQRIREEGPLPFIEVEKVLRDVARALAYAHRNRIVHRDIKPENVYLDDGADCARLADFGIARAWDSDSGLTLPGTAIGTPAYMSPEQVAGKELDGRSDLYGLGLLGYEMLTGHQPWAGESLYSIIYKQKHEDLPPVSDARPDIPAPLRVALEGATRKRRETRWPNAEAFLDALAGGSGLPSEDDGLPWLPEDVEEEGEGSAEESAPWSENLEEQRTISYSRTDAPGEGEAGTGTAPVKGRGSIWLFAVLMVVAVLVAGLGVDAVVSGPGGYTHTLLGSLSQGDVAEEGVGADGAPDAPGEPEGTGNGLEHILAEEGGPGEAVDPAPPQPVETGEGGPVPAERRPAQVEVIRGDAQEGTIHQVLPQPLELRVLDEEGEPLLGTVVRFEVAGGVGEVYPPTAVSDGDGVARAIWTLGPEAGEQVVTAAVEREGDPEVTAQFEAQAGVPTLPIRAGVAAGGTHTCVLRSDGSTTCWGANDAGQLGDGSSSARVAATTPVDQGPFSVVTSGMSHVCALDPEGHAYCWGSNDRGQLGVGDLSRRNAPNPVDSGLGFSDLAAGAVHTCGITRAGAAFCWGGNEEGQLGDGTVPGRSAPVRVGSDRVFRQIAPGWGHTCALDDAGNAFCWGSNASGELGSGEDTSSARAPRAVVGEHRFRSVAAGSSHTCGLREDGQLLCWGSNAHGQLGDGTSEDSSRPTPVGGGERYRQVIAGGVHTCGLTTEDVAFCWGRNLYGQVGDGSTTDRSQPVPVVGDRRFQSLHAFGSHTCGRTPGGDLLCWGYNVDGQLGDGSRTNRSVPTEASGVRP